jgi:endonuclease-8
VPEGDTIFRAADTLHRALAGRIVTSFRTVLVQLARVDEDAPVAGRTVERVVSQGKHLLMHFSGDLILRTHMRMHGSWHVYRPGERWQRPGLDMRIVVATSAFEAVAFSVPVAEFRTAETLARDPVIRSLGPDLAARTFDLQDAVARVRAAGPQRIADVLLQQRVVAGIGNVFKSEALFEAGLSPFALVPALDSAAIERLVSVARRQVQMNTAVGERRLVAGRGGRRTTRSANPDAQLWVYGRGGLPCRRCGHPIAMDKSGEDARLTYYCPRCQAVG